MKRTISLFQISFLVLIITGCEGYRCVIGVVKDKQTNELLDSVYINVVSGSVKTFSDSLGNFNVCNNLAGCVPKCKDIVIEFSKNGYKKVQEINPSPNAIIYLERQ